MSDPSESSEAIEAAAAEWVVRLDRSEGDPRQRAAFEAWSGADPRRYGAYLRAKAGWRLLDGLFDAEVSAADPVVRRPAGSVSISRRKLWMGAAAAAVPVTLGIAISGAFRSVSYATGVGEVRQVMLPDGSQMTLNTSSAVSAHIGANQRRVTVAAGEVWFDVAHDKRRPFLVQTGFARVRAVGTRFVVRNDPRGSEVVVEEGAIDAWSEASDRSEPLRMKRGARVYATNAALVSLEPVNAAELARSLAWRSGHVVFQGETVAEAALKLNAYNDQKIVIADRSLGSERIVGYFRLKDPQAFAAAVAASFGAVSKTTSTTILLFSPPEKS
jgi:transmembrane sensor